MRGLQATLVPLKTDYAPGEPVQALVYLTNTTAGDDARVIALDGRLVFLAHIRVHILDDAGQQVQYPNYNAYRDLGIITQGDFIRILPGRFYGSLIADEWRIAVPRAGVFEVYATVQCWEDGHEFGLDAWTGKLESDRVSITVVDPRAAGRSR